MAWIPFLVLLIALHVIVSLRLLRQYERAVVFLLKKFEPWGTQVTAVEIKDITLPENMQRPMAKEAEAERERRAKIVAAEGEYQAAVKLGEAADIITRHPVAAPHIADDGGNLG